MTLLKSIKEFMRVTATIDPEVICPHRTLGDSSVIQQKAWRISSKLNRFQSESFNFNKFIKELYSEENVLDIDSDIHNQLTHPSVRDMPHYITGKEFPRLQLAEELKYEGSSESDAINLAFSENAFVSGLHIDDGDDQAHPEKPCEIYTLANDDVLNLIIKTDFIKSVCDIRGTKNINEFRKCKIGKWVDYQLSVIYPSYKVVCRMKNICNAFEKEFQLARFMCLKGLAEAIYIFLYEIEKGAKYKDLDYVSQDIINTTVQLDSIINYFSTRNNIISGIELDSHKNLVMEAEALRAHLNLKNEQNKILQRDSVNYATRKMSLRVTHSLCASNIGNTKLTANKMVKAIMAMLNLGYDKTEIKKDIVAYMEWYYLDATQNLINSLRYIPPRFKVKSGSKKNEDGTDGYSNFLYGFFKPE